MSNQFATKRKRGDESFFENPTTRRLISITFKVILGLLVLTYSVFPIVWTFSAAINPSGGLSTQKLIPDNASFANFEQMINEEPFFLWIWNSVKIAGISSLAAGAITTVSAYAFSRYRFWGRSNMLAGILLIQVFPNILAMVALYALLQQIGQYIPWLGLNSHGGLILIYLGGAMGFNVWLMKGFFDSIPRDLDESAMVDGANQVQIFFRIILPLVRPMIAVVMVLAFFGAYSDWLLPRLMLTDESTFTLMLGIEKFINAGYDQNWGAFAAGAIMGSLPMVLVYILLQDWIVGGLTAGSVKG